MKQESLYPEYENKKAFVVANGNVRDYSATLLRMKKDYGFCRNSFVVAVNGGTRHCISMRIFPDVILGDMDSMNLKIMEEIKNNTKDIKFINSSSEKDESDTQLALDYLFKSGYQKVIVVGAFGNRIDHSFANLVLMASDSYRGKDIRMITEDEEIFVTGQSCEIHGRTGKRLSIFSLSPYTIFKSTRGLKYKLGREKLFFSPARGLSNIFTEDTAKINIKEGTLLIIQEV